MTVDSIEVKPNAVSAFARLATALPQQLAALVNARPVRQGKFPQGMGKVSGVYLFSENEQHIYIGRSRDIMGRYRSHTRGNLYSASLAFLFTCEQRGDAQPAYGTKQALVRKGLLRDRQFMYQFEVQKARLRAMTFRWFEEDNDLKQALLEIYCAVELAPCYNAFATG